MRYLVKICESEVKDKTTIFVPLKLIERKLKAQIGRHDITILNITRVENIEENRLDCYVDYEFWGEK